MAKKLLALLMAVSMCIALVPAVAETATPSVAEQFGWTVPEETLKIVAFFNSDNYSTGEEQKVGLANMHDYILQNFNVDYTFITSDASADEDLNLLLASGTYPDLIIGASTTNRQRFMEQGRIAEITEYMNAETSPNLMKRLGSMAGLYADDEGRYYYLPRGFSNLMDSPDYSAHVRYDEYEEIGSPAIVTPEDYMNTIMTIYNAHPTTDAGETRYSLSLYDQGMPEDLGGYWGLQKGWKVNDDNTLTYWTETEEGKDMARFFNTWWRTGTMDPDSFINTWNDCRTKISQKRVVGMIGGWWIGYNAGHEVWSLTAPDWTENMRYIQVSFKDENAENAYLTLKNNAGSTWTFITDKCTDVAGVMRWIDFTMSDKGIALTCWGIPNEVESYNNPGTTECIWELYEDGTWKFNDVAHQQLVSETWDYNEEGIFGANNHVYVPLEYNGRFEDGIHCLWPNQMWYNENKWKNIMLENMAGTIFDGTALLFQSIPMDEDVTFAKEAVANAWKQYYPLACMASTDEEFETAWTNLQNAVRNAGLDDYTAYYTENYQKNVASMSK